MKRIPIVICMTLLSCVFFAVWISLFVQDVPERQPNTIVRSGYAGVPIERGRYIPPFPERTGQETYDVLQRINYYRGVAGVSSVKYDETLSAGCRAHIRYMQEHNVLLHSEEEGKTGYTAEGAEAAYHSNLARDVADLPTAVDMWMYSLYHRLPLLEPALTHIGFAYSNNGGFACMNLSTIDMRNYNTRTGPVVFPGYGMTQVQPIWYGGEQPDPLETHTDIYPTGIPITISFSSQDVITDIQMQVVDEAHQEQVGYLQLPHAPDDPYTVEQRNTVSFIAAKPFAEHARYTVHVEGKVNNSPFVREWEFTTGESY